MPTKRPISGILLLDKPPGMSSNGALQQVKRLYQARKAGHTGALDPLATGVLPICFGEATKFTQYLLNADKAYQVTACLGITTDTGDADGATLGEATYEQVSANLIEQSLVPLRGAISQLPPLYSALKYQGKPLYKYARAGQAVPLQPRSVHIYKLSIVQYVPPNLELYVHCSKGTYVRSLVSDLGEALGCGAHVAKLRRVQAGSFLAEQTHTLESLFTTVNQPPGTHDSNPAVNPLDALLLPPDTAVLHLNAVHLHPQQVVALQQGKEVAWHRDGTTEASKDPSPTLVRVYDVNNDFVGLAQLRAEGTIKAQRLLQLS